ncbi:asparagine synthase (glutamine-hydrolyzing) [Mucilaginibacter arboris]|uniref:asparagine synthase (glutamine-hydrolyzing) n=1 Tax=Mucilaginibacter arboris TaxID=2682090 RepID=A0A7K1STJ6_9SPHI|nr:asparagine synthase (glutamine-hydrolyzing) [Mucilaginibacter arboris]MVN20628.1 asparagine synthase (glutamine-hydrolyzing) [Mucilaginibacter arboris]
MCRIAGQVSLNTHADQKRRLVNRMCLAMQHGGPDGEGLFLADKNSICFGHRRLALIDLSADGTQPMQDITENYTVTFNGEIYNYLELKAELQNLGYQFKTKSDTEVILVAYASWGTNAFHRFNGMFAFALYDKRLQKVFLVRDGSGMKPLYYHIKNKELIFASEIRAFREIGFSQNRPDWKILFLAFGFIPEPVTILDQVLMLPKGSFLEWKIDAETYRTSSYLQPKTVQLICNQKEAEQLVQQKLHKAVNRHLIADAPIGVFLSGGIDSGIIALEASAVKGKALHTLSLTFEEAGYDESKFQQIMATKLGSRHQQQQITAADFNEQATAILQAMDQPSADGINTWLVAKLAQKQGLKAVLSGLGGDELFGGYPSFKRMHLLKKMESQLSISVLKWFQQSPKEAYQKLAYLSLRSEVGYYLALRGYFAPHQIAAILNIPVKEVWAKISEFKYPAITETNPELFAANLEQDFYMKNQLLRDTDAMSMQHGIEIRMPFLDTEFLLAVNSISSNLRFDKKLAKGLLVRSYQQQLPATIWNRKKMGFSFPLQKWLKQHPLTVKLNTSTNLAVASFTQRFLQDKMHWSKLLALHFAANT